MYGMLLESVQYFVQVSVPLKIHYALLIDYSMEIILFYAMHRNYEILNQIYIEIPLAPSNAPNQLGSGANDPLCFV